MSAPAAPAVPALGNSPTAPANPTARTADDFHDYPRDQWGRPLIVQLDEHGQPIMVWSTVDKAMVPLRLAYTRSSRAGSVLEYQGALNSYDIRNACIGLTVREDLYYLAKSIHEPGGEGRREFDKTVVKPAQEAAGASGAANMGTALHSFAEKSDRGELVPQLGPYQASLDAYRRLTAGWLWHGIECRLISDKFRLAGKADRIGSPPGWMVAPDGRIIGPDDRLVLDLKTSSSNRYFGVKFAVQLTGYAYGDLYDLQTFARTKTGARTDWGLVIHVPTGGSSGALYWVNLKRGVELVALARQVLDAQGEKDLVVQVADTAIYATLGEAQNAAALISGGVTAGITVAAPEPDADEGDPEPSTSVDQASEVKAMVAGWLDRGYEGGQAGAGAVLDALTGQWNPAVTDPATGVRSDGTYGPDATGNDPADPTPISSNLGPHLQRLAAERAAASDPAAVKARELAVIAEAGVTSPLAALRVRYTGSWSAEHEAAYAQREWELGIITAIGKSSTIDNLDAIAAMVVGWGRWTREMKVMARRRADALAAGTGDGS